MNRQTKAATLHRRQRVEELLAAGLESSVKIAKVLAAEGITVTDRTVRDDIAAVGADWHASIVQLRHVRQMRKVSAADRRNAELLAEWDRSKQDKQRRREKAKQKGAKLGDDGKPDQNQVPDETEAEQSTEGRIGDVSLLTEVRRNDEYIARLLGLEEPKRVAVGGDPDAPPIPLEVKEVVVRSRAEAVGLLSRLSEAGRLSGRN